MTDHPEAIRRIVDSVDPVTAAEARVLAGADPAGGDARPSPARRAPALALIGAAVVAALVTVVLVVRSPGSPTVDTMQEGSTIPTTIATTTPGPPPTVLAPIGGDPEVSCDIVNQRWFRLSAWSGPPDPRLDLPAAEVLRSTYVINDMARTNDAPLPFPDVPIESWRLVSADDELVVWGLGELDLDTVVSDELGPVLRFLEADLVDGVWQYSGGGGGTCNELYVRPPEGATIAWWGPAGLPDPEADTITINVGSHERCGPQLAAEDLLGPDVVETDGSVSIRVAIDRPPLTVEEQVECFRMREGPPDQNVVAIVVPLTAPLGDRQLLDANQFPAHPVDLDAIRVREQTSGTAPR